jgi:hypothetical protein
VCKPSVSRCERSRIDLAEAWRELALESRFELVDVVAGEVKPIEGAPLHFAAGTSIALIMSHGEGLVLRLTFEAAPLCKKLKRCWGLAVVLTWCAETREVARKGKVLYI